MEHELKQKVELRVGKAGPLRFISHHDMVRLVERAFRRAGLPLRLTAGYNAKPRIVLPLPLEVGTESMDEAVETELYDWVPVAEIRSRVAAALPRHVPLHSVKLLPPRRQSQPPVEAYYECRPDAAGLRVGAERIKEFMESDSIPWKRIRPDSEVALDLRKGVVELADENGVLKMRLKAGSGSVRPTEVLAWLTGDVSAAKLVPVKRVRTVLAPVELGGRPTHKRRPGRQR